MIFENDVRSKLSQDKTIYFSCGTKGSGKTQLFYGTKTEDGIVQKSIKEAVKSAGSGVEVQIIQFFTKGQYDLLTALEENKEEFSLDKVSGQPSTIMSKYLDRSHTLGEDRIKLQRKLREKKVTLIENPRTRVSTEIKGCKWHKLESESEANRLISILSRYIHDKNLFVNSSIIVNLKISDRIHTFIDLSREEKISNAEVYSIEQYLKNRNKTLINRNARFIHHLTKNAS